MRHDRARSEMSARRPYRIRFAERRELDRDDFVASEPYEPGDVLEGFREGLDDPAHAWAVATVVPGRDGRPDTPVYDRRSTAGVEVFVASDIGVPAIHVRLGLLRRGLVAEWPGGSAAT